MAKNKDRMFAPVISLIFSMSLWGIFSSHFANDIRVQTISLEHELERDHTRVHNNDTNFVFTTQRFWDGYSSESKQMTGDRC